MWQQITLTNLKGVTRYIGELAKQRSHYATKGDTQIRDYIQKKRGIECWIYDGDGFSCGILLYYKNKTNLGGASACIANAWYTGDVTGEQAFDVLIEKVKEYCEKYGSPTIFHKQFKDTSGQVSELLISKPYDESLHIQKLKEHFTTVEVQEEDNYFCYLATL